MEPYQHQDTYEVEAATRLSRLGAVLIDALVGFAPLGAIAVLLPPALLSGQVGSLLIVLVAAGGVALAVLIIQIVLVATRGQTIGKKALGIRMITSDGDIPSIWRVFFLRWLPFAVVSTVIQFALKVPGMGGLIHLLDAVFIFQPTRRCLHDLFADTHVVKV